MKEISAVAGTSSHDRDDARLPHILLVVDQFPKNLGGGERIVLRLAALLPRYGYRVSILTFFIHSQCDVVSSGTCPIYLLPLQRTYDVNAFKAALQLRRFIRLQNVQIVQTFFESSDIWAGIVTKLFSNAKLIWSRRDMGILRTSKHRVAYRLIADVPNAVFAVSERVRRHCIDVDRIDAARVHTVYNGLDLAANGAEVRSREVGANVRIVTVGNIRRVKGHDLFIRAAKAVVEQFPATSFSIGGEVLEPDYFSELQGLVRDLNLGDHFHFAGGIADPRGYLSEADIFVLPSRSEGFSNAIVEAMAASLPVIATAVGGNAEAVEDGVTGLIVPPEDSNALAAAISHLLQNPLQASAMGKAGRIRAQETFTTEAMMEKIVAVYRNLLA